MKIQRQMIYFKKKIPCHGLLFFPNEDKKKIDASVVMTHGYTSEKTSIINWAQRLTEIGVTCFLFDLPGHYLSSFQDVESFEDFRNNAHLLFLEAVQLLPKTSHLILAGHSLGALLALKAQSEINFQIENVASVGVGLGMAPEHVVHLFDTPFYQETLKFRAQLVSPALHPDLVFPWIKEEKEALKIEGKRIHLISGEDDLVVGQSGAIRLKENLEKKYNTVTLEVPSKLPHHEPGLAALYLKKFVRSFTNQ